MRSPRKKIMILLPTLPQYRVDFFSKLNDILKDKYDLLVVHGDKTKNKVLNYGEKRTFKTKECVNVEINLFKYRIVFQKRLIGTFFSFKPDAVIVLFNPGNLFFVGILIVCKIMGIPFGLWGCGYKRPEIKGMRYLVKESVIGSFLKRASVHIAYGSRYARELIRKGITKENIFVAQNTINVENIINNTNKSPKSYLREKLGIDVNATLFLFVGALIYDKKIDQAIKAFNQLKNEGYKFRFIIIGDGEERLSLTQLIAQYKLEDKIILAGPTYGDTLSEYFGAADVFILPGTGGLAINEAMAYGLPIISTVGDGTVVDLLENSENGFLLNDELNEKGVTDACRMFLQLDSNKKNDMGNKSLKIIQEKASLSNMVSNYYEAIHKLCS